MQRRQQVRRDIGRHDGLDGDGGPEDHGRRGNERPRQGDDIQIILEVGSEATVSSGALARRWAFSLLAEAAQIPPAGISKEHISAVESVRGRGDSPLQLAFTIAGEKMVAAIKTIWPVWEQHLFANEWH